MDVEKHRSARGDDEAIVANIKKALRQFLVSTPDYYPIPENEATMFATMEKADDLTPTRPADWIECFALCRDKLKEKPAPRKQSQVGPVLTRTEVESWSALRMQKEIESSPRREREIEAALSR